MSRSTWPTNVGINISDAIIDGSKGCDPIGCEIKVATKVAIGGHGYVNVDASGVAITRRNDYREKAFLTRPLQAWMIAFDKWSRNAGPRPKAIKATLVFHKTTKIVKRDRDEINAARQARAARGIKQKKYTMRERVVGLAQAMAL
jgi:hypothetical protein